MNLTFLLDCFDAGMVNRFADRGRTTIVP